MRRGVPKRFYDHDQLNPRVKAKASTGRPLAHSRGLKESELGLPRRVSNSGLRLVHSGGPGTQQAVPPPGTVLAARPPDSRGLGQTGGGAGGRGEGGPDGQCRLLSAAGPARDTCRRADLLFPSTPSSCSARGAALPDAGPRLSRLRGSGRREPWTVTGGAAGASDHSSRRPTGAHALPSENSTQFCTVGFSFFRTANVRFGEVIITTGVKQNTQQPA